METFVEGILYVAVLGCEVIVFEGVVVSIVDVEVVAAVDGTVVVVVLVLAVVVLVETTFETAGTVDFVVVLAVNIGADVSNEGSAASACNGTANFVAEGGAE